ncbi:MAG TPA: hypothetical protein VGH33_00705 [Isosphaeraceae bacterium]
MMNLGELLPAIQGLSRAEKIRLIQALADELAGEEGITIVSGSTFPVWSPHNAHDAAETLLEALASPGGD